MKILKYISSIYLYLFNNKIDFTLNIKISNKLNTSVHLSKLLKFMYKEKINYSSFSLKMLTLLLEIKSIKTCQASSFIRI